MLIDIDFQDHDVKGAIVENIAGYRKMVAVEPPRFTKMYNPKNLVPASTIYVHNP